MRGEPASHRFQSTSGPCRGALRRLTLALFVALPVILLAAGLAGLCGCGRGGGEPQEEVRVSGEAEWAWLQQKKQELDVKRERLAQARAGVQPGAPVPPPVADQEKEVRALAEELHRRLVDFINAHPPVEDEPLSGRQLAAVRMKSDEDILLAREHIERGGDYRRALDIYEAALAVDPDNPRLRDELERARARRYMTAERFAQVKEGMTQDQVRAVLGQPNLNNVREYPDKGITAWFYTRDAQGGAAAVWFQREGKGAVVYALDFEALGPRRPAS